MSVKYVEYLYGDNNSYIDTGIVVQSGYQIEVTFMSTENKLSMQKNDWSGIFGVGNLIGYSYDTAPYGISVGLYGSRVAVKNNNVTKLDYLNIDGTCYNQKYTLSLTAGENVTNPANLFLFAVNFTRNAGQSNPNSWGYSCLRIYDFKIYNAQGTLIQHLKPCLDDNNVPCMYDEVSGEYFENLGTGTFGYEGYHLYLFANNNNATAENLGSYRLYNMKIEGDSEGVESGVDYVDCLIGDNDSWIDTGIVAKPNYRIEATFTSTVDRYAYYAPENKSFSAIWGASASTGYSYDREPYGVSLSFKDTMVHVKNGGVLSSPVGISVSCLNKKYTHSVIVSENVTNVNNLYLFAINFNGVTYNYAENTTKIYDFKIYNAEGTLIQHLRPCLDTEGVPCMYDEVSGEYFKNLGTGTFGYKKTLRDFQPVLDSNGTPTLMDKVNKKYYYDKNGNGFKYNGYTPVGYLQGDGASWIDTNIYTNPQCKYELIQSGTGNEYGIMLSANDEVRIGNASSDGLRGAYNQVTYTILYSFKNNYGDEGAYTITLDKNKLYLEEQLFHEFDTVDNITSYANPLRLFKAYSSRTDIYQIATNRFISLKVWNENNELITHIIPVLDSEGTPCMYDLVTETFFYNQGTGEFSYGIEEDECPPVDYVGYIKNPQTEGVYDEFIKVPNMLFDETWKKIKAKYYTRTNNQSRLWEIFNGRFSLATNYGAFVFGYTNENGENKSLELFRNAGIAPDNNTMMYFDVEWTPGNFNINGINQTYEGIAQSQSGGVGRELRLCSNRMVGGIQYFTVYGENDVILLDLHACVDDNGVACLYDTIAKDFIYPVGTNPFTAEDGIIGYTPIKYIETNGTQYIDTGVVPTDNTDIDMVARAVEGTTYKLDYFESSSGFNYLIPIHVDSFNSVITNHSDVTVRLDCYTESLDWWGIVNIASGETVDFNASYENCKHICICFQDTDIVKLNEYTFMLNNLTDSFTSNYLEDLPTCSLYLMNGLTIDTTYNFNEIDTTVEPNLTASAGATLTLGSTYMAFLTETEIEQAINNGWTIE